MSDAEARLHFRIDYLGDAFWYKSNWIWNGQGELIHAFEKLGWISKDAKEHNLVFQVEPMPGFTFDLMGQYELLNRFGTTLHLASSFVR